MQSDDEATEVLLSGVVVQVEIRSSMEMIWPLWNRPKEK